MKQFDETALLSALRNNDLSYLERYLIEGGDPDYKIENKKMPLICKEAALLKLNFVNLLLKYGANPNETTDKNETALFLICKPLSLENCKDYLIRLSIIDSLLKAGAKSDIKPNYPGAEYPSSYINQSLNIDSDKKFFILKSFFENGSSPYLLATTLSKLLIIKVKEYKPSPLSNYAHLDLGEEYYEYLETYKGIRIEGLLGENLPLRGEKEYYPLWQIRILEFIEFKSKEKDLKLTEITIPYALGYLCDMAKVVREEMQNEGIKFNREIFIEKRESLSEKLLKDLEIIDKGIAYIFDNSKSPIPDDILAKLLKPSLYLKDNIKEENNTLVDSKVSFSNKLNSLINFTTTEALCAQIEKTEELGSALRDLLKSPCVIMLDFDQEKMIYEALNHFIIEEPNEYGVNLVGSEVA